MEDESSATAIAVQETTCDPEIETCYEYETVVDQGDVLPTIWIGLAALLKAIMPVILRYAAADSDVTATTSDLYPSAFGVWWIGNIIVWGLLTLLWPITYFSITVIIDFYLAATWWGGYWGGIGLASLAAILLLVSATQDSNAWTYFIV